MHVYMYFVYCYNSMRVLHTTLEKLSYTLTRLTSLLIEGESTTLTPTRTRVIHPPLELSSSTHKPTRIEYMTTLVSEFVALVLVRQNYCGRHGV
jgi:hypothetical protein